MEEAYLLMFAVHTIHPIPGDEAYLIAEGVEMQYII